MDDPIFCPKCEGTQHEHNPYNPRIHHPLVSAAHFLVNFWRWRPFIIMHYDTDEDYVPESYRCKSCGHSFLSSETYAGELRYYQMLRSKWLFWGILQVVLIIFLAFALVLDCCAYFPNVEHIWVYIQPMIPLLALSYIFLGAIHFSLKESRNLQEEWVEFQNVQARNTETINNTPREYVPAWKRVQMEDQGQGSL